MDITQIVKTSTNKQQKFTLKILLTCDSYSVDYTVIRKNIKNLNENVLKLFFSFLLIIKGTFL